MSADPKSPNSTDLKQRVAHLAQLARLELSPQEVETFAGQLGKILTYVQDLQKVDLRGPAGEKIEPLYHPIELATAMRKDEVVPLVRNAQGKAKVLDSAPEVLYDGYKVPQIL